MNSPQSILSRLLQTLTGRDVRAAGNRRGSVLILVVAILVLLALIGTAALSTNTIDRYASQQNMANTEVDLLIEGEKNIAKSILAGDLYDQSKSPPQYRPIESATSTYDSYEMPLLVDPHNQPLGMEDNLFKELMTANDAWLSPRYPTLMDPTPTAVAFNPASNTYNGNPPVWDAIGAPLDVANGVASAGAQLFDSPLSGLGSFGAGTINGGTTSLSYSWRVTRRDAFSSTFNSTGTQQNFNNDAVLFRPDYISQYNAPGVSATFNPPLPAWTLPNPDNPSQYIKFVAGDADGDGIPDCALRKIPVGQLNGITYYVGVRIIDNGSAINVNAAMSRDHEFLGTGSFAFYGSGNGGPGTIPQATGFFPSNIALAELLRSYDPTTTNGGSGNLAQMHLNGGTFSEFGWIDNYRFNTFLPPNFPPSGVMKNQSSSGNQVTGPAFVDMPPGAAGATQSRPDFAYNTLNEALYFGLTTRLNNPGVVNSAGGVDTRYQRFTTADSAALAYHFVLANPNASLSVLESMTTQGIPNASGANLDSLYYSAGNERNNSARDQSAGFATTIIQNSAYQLTPLGIGYWFRDNFDYDREFATGGGPAYKVEFPGLYMNRRSMFTADSPSSSLIGTSGSIALAKASVNTASWGDLYNAYLSVITEPNFTTGAPDTPYNAQMQADPLSMYSFAGMRFNEVAVVTAGLTSPDPNAASQSYKGFFPKIDTNPQRMFRNVARDNDSTPTRKGGDTIYYDDVNNKQPATVSRSGVVELRPAEVRKLRAYIAASNTLSMRGSTVGCFPVTAASFGANALTMTEARSSTQAVDLYVYPVKPQPYITEVYVNTDTNHAAAEYDPGDTTAPGTPNGEPYVAIEIFYPYLIPQQSGTPPATGAPWDMRPSSSGTAGWIIAAQDRRRIGIDQHLPPATVIKQFTNADNNAYFTAPPLTQDPRYGSYIILENFDESGTDATSTVKFRPESSGLPYVGQINNFHTTTASPPVKSVYVKDLAKLIQAGQPGIPASSELIIFQPVTGTPTPPAKPLDSFDFTGLANDSATGLGHVWHYARQGEQVNANTGNFWMFVYPGRYDGAALTRRHEGTQAGDWDNSVNPLHDLTQAQYRDPFAPFSRTQGSVLDPPPSFGTIWTLNGWTSTDSASLHATFTNTFHTQILALDQPGWNGLNSTLNRFPFGAFARNSDILQIPFIAAYRIEKAGQSVDMEINSLSMDAAFAEDTDLVDDENGPYTIGPTFETTEQIGRFCPVNAQSNSGLPNTAKLIDDLDPNPLSSYRYYFPDQTKFTKENLPLPAWRYHWTTRLLDYLTVQDPQSDYSPNVDPASYTATGFPSPVPVSNEGGTAGASNGTAINGESVANAENSVPVHGLININTASWRVLSAINWTPYAQNDPKRDQFTLVNDPNGQFTFNDLPGGANQVDDNVEIAKAIVYWRDGIQGNGAAGYEGPHGPFKSIYDIYRVPAVRKYYTNLIQLQPEPDDSAGDFSPFNYNPLVSITGGNGKYPILDGVRNDFEERFQLLNRVGNLITTRSDAFTVYIVVQGWRNVGSSNKAPEKVVERRAAFIADRSKITANGGSLIITPVPTD